MEELPRVLGHRGPDKLVDPGAQVPDHGRVGGVGRQGGARYGAELEADGRVIGFAQVLVQGHDAPEESRPSVLQHDHVRHAGRGRGLDWDGPSVSQACVPKGPEVIGRVQRLVRVEGVVEDKILLRVLAT